MKLYGSATLGTSTYFPDIVRNFYKANGNHYYCFLNAVLCVLQHSSLNTYERDIVTRLFLNAGTEVSLRLSSLDYLGLVASRLRRDAVQSKLKLETIDTIINSVKVRRLKSSVADPDPDLVPF
jgi:hypothetical protein